MTALRTTLLALAASSLLAPLAVCQSDVEIEADLKFALGLAERFRYVDLAEAVLESVDARGVSGEQEAALDLARCTVYGGVARREPNPEEREILYQKALDAYRGFLDRHPFAENVTSARREYVDLVNAYGRVLEAALEEQIAEEAEATRGRLTAELEAGLELTGELIDGVPADATETEKQAKYRLMLSRGQMLLTLAKVSSEPSFLFAQAERTLEDLALDAGETSVSGLQAYLLLGEVKVAQNQFGDAQAFMEFVADIAVPKDAQARTDLGWEEYPPQVKQQRFKMLELGMAALVNAYAAGGDAAGGVRWGLHMLNVRNADGLTLSPRGDLALLALARALLTSGGYVGGLLNRGTLKWFETEEAMEAEFSGRRNQRSAIDLALTLAQDVNDRNKGNTLQIRAQAVISEITERPGVEVSPDVLFEAAQGRYYSKEFDAAIAAFQEIRSLLDTQDDATRKEFGARTLNFLGNAYDRTGRKLEAGLTFKEAIKRYEGDPEFDSKNARSYLAMAKELRSASAQAPVFVDMVKDAENEVIAHQDDDADPGKILIDQGDRRYDSKDYADARAKYLEVDPNSKYYEKAVTKAALCLYKEEAKAKALEEFKQYADGYVQDGSNEVTDDTRQTVRREAMAMATFYIGRIAFAEGDVDEAIQRLDGYHEKFPAQDDYGPVALYTVLKGRLAKRQVDQAKAVLDDLVESFASSKLTGRAAFDVYQTVKTAAGDEPTKAQLVEMAELLGRYNDLSEPSFANSRQVSKLLLDAEEWAKAEASLRAMQSTFTGPEDAENMEKFVLPDLAQTLLEQKKVPEAFAILDPIVPDPDSDERTSPTTVRMYCRAVTGWLEGDERNVVEVPGVGGPENLEKASQYWSKLTGAEGNRDKWTCPWYELKMMHAYCYYQWGKLDSSKREPGKRILEDLVSVGFQGDREMKPVAEACGDDLLRRRMLWVLGKL